MVIRSAKREDAYTISKLIERAALPQKEQDFNEDGWHRFLASNSETGLDAKISEDGRCTLVAEEGRQILGLISVTGDGKIDLLFVCPNQRRRGIATHLWRAICSQCETSSDSTSFWVRSSSAGVAFYESLGFTTEGDRQSVSGISFVLMKLGVNKKLSGDAADGAR